MCPAIFRNEVRVGVLAIQDRGRLYQVRGGAVALVIAADLTLPERIDALLDAEIAEAQGSGAVVLQRLAAEFALVRQVPLEVTANFSGGITQRCWAVTRGDGTYRVVYLPLAGYFSLCVESDVGLLDIGVHGPALGCFGSV